MTTYLVDREFGFQRGDGSEPPIRTNRVSTDDMRHMLVGGWCPPPEDGQQQRLWPAVRCTLSTGTGNKLIQTFWYWDGADPFASNARRRVTTNEIKAIFADPARPEWTKAIWFESPHGLQFTDSGKNVAPFWSRSFWAELNVPAGSDYLYEDTRRAITGRVAEVFEPLRDCNVGNIVLDDEWRCDLVELGRPSTDTWKNPFGSGGLERLRSVIATGALDAPLRMFDLTRDDMLKLIDAKLWPAELWKSPVHQRWVATTRHIHATMTRWLFATIHETLYDAPSAAGNPFGISLCHGNYLPLTAGAEPEASPYYPRAGVGNAANWSAVKLYGFAPPDREATDWTRAVCDLRRLAGCLHATPDEVPIAVVLQCNSENPACGDPAWWHDTEFGAGVLEAVRPLPCVVSQKFPPGTDKPEQRAAWKYYVEQWFAGDDLVRNHTADALPLRAPRIPSYDADKIDSDDGFDSEIQNPSPPPPPVDDNAEAKRLAEALAAAKLELENAQSQLATANGKLDAETEARKNAEFDRNYFMGLVSRVTNERDEAWSTNKTQAARLDLLEPVGVALKTIHKAVADL